VTRSSWVFNRRGVRWLLCFVAAGWGGLGCGLTQYEGKMEEQQDRLDYMEQENKHLSPGYLQLPPTKEDKKVIIPGNHFFCRPPIGISLTPTEQKLGDVLYVFPATSNKSPIREMLAGMAKAGKSSKFTEEVLSALGIMASTKKYRELRPPGRPVMRFEQYQESDGEQITDVYFYRQDAPYEVAIAFRVTLQGGKESAVKEDIDYSLRSLRAGSVAYEMHKIYRPPPGSMPGQAPLEHGILKKGAQL
jgi:hypothetical protein